MESIVRGVYNMFCVTGNSVYLVHRAETLFPVTERTRTEYP